MRWGLRKSQKAVQGAPLGGAFGRPSVDPSGGPSTDSLGPYGRAATKSAYFFSRENFENGSG